MLRQTLGQALHDARQAQGIKVRELATRVGLDVSTVYGIERGQLFPSFTVLCRLADALKLEIDLRLTPSR